ncbi:MAG: hypothetical protein IKF77_04045 [Thermoguttaceae bacterium]|nr:hypothetical protein [Thermoguttaceae bacterium]
MIKISARVVLFALVVTASVTVCHRAAAAEEDGVEIFLKAIDPEGPAAIKTGNIFYQRCVDYGQMTEEDIQAICEKVITHRKEEIARHNEEYPEDIVEEPDEEKISAEIHAKYSEKHIFSGYFIFDYSQKDYRYTKAAPCSDMMPGTVMIELDNLRGTDGGGPKFETMIFEPSYLCVDNNNWCSNWDFPRFGRVTGRLASTCAYRAAETNKPLTRGDIQEQLRKLYRCDGALTVLRIAGTEPYEDGCEAYLLENAVDDTVIERYTIVPSMGYICPKIELFDPVSGHPVQEYKAERFVKPSRTDTLYPCVWTESRWDVSTGKLVKRTVFTIDQEKLAVNEPVKRSVFTLEVPKDYCVNDVRQMTNDCSIAVRKGVFKLKPGFTDLEQYSWLKKQDDLRGSESSRPLPPPVRRLLIAAGAVIIIAALLVKRKETKKRAAA